MAISSFPEEYNKIGQGYIGVFPVQMLILVVMAVIGYVLVNYTLWGRCLSVIGNSPVAAKYSGIKVEKYTVLAYVFAAVCCAIGGIIMSARVATRALRPRATYQMQVIAAVLLGGTSFTGGQGKILGSVVGVLIFAILSNGFNLAGASAFLQQLVNGVILIVVLVVRVTMDQRKEHRLIQKTMQEEKH
jgi:ribose/xylose/arabinose/galactoside ABC-type transport system permease subunit